MPLPEVSFFLNAPILRMNSLTSILRPESDFARSIMFVMDLLDFFQKNVAIFISRANKEAKGGLLSVGKVYLCSKRAQQFGVRGENAVEACKWIPNGRNGKKRPHSAGKTGCGRGKTHCSRGNEKGLLRQ